MILITYKYKTETTFFTGSIFPSWCFADGVELPRGGLGEAEQGEGPSGLVQSHVVVAGTTQGAHHQRRGHQGPQ